MSLFVLTDELIFPHPNRALADPNGLLAVGGDLAAERLKLAYQNGIFPWYNEDEPILWWSPDPRAVFDPLQFHLSRSFKKFIKQCNYHVTINHDFAKVIKACSISHGDTWITPQIIDAYIQLHQLGFAHSIEVWQNSELIGGMYGVAQGTLFCGESMFSLQTNASKLGLYAFCLHFVAHGGILIDCQVLNDHTESFGAFDIARVDYLAYLSQLQIDLIDLNCYNPQLLNYKYK